MRSGGPFFGGFLLFFPFHSKGYQGFLFLGFFSFFFQAFSGAWLVLFQCCSGFAKAVASSSGFSTELQSLTPKRSKGSKSSSGPTTSGASKLGVFFLFFFWGGVLWECCFFLKGLLFLKLLEFVSFVCVSLAGRYL